ncbi:MAG: protein kinase [Polyangiaceae bacterium]
MLSQPAFLEARRGAITMSQPLSLQGPRPSGFGDDRPSIFTFAPINRPDGPQVGVLGFRLDPAAELSQLLALGRLGDSGESFAFDRAGKMVSSSRFASQLRQAGLIQGSGILEVELRDPGKPVESASDVSAEHPFTRPVRSILAGKDGQDLDGWRDYRGHEEVGSWTWLPELRVGVVTEEDRSEAYSIISMTRWVAVGLIVLVVCASAVVIVFSRFAMTLEAKAAAVVELGQYTLGTKIGEGGMGSVYQAQHALLARPTAIKLLKPTTTDALQRFEREVQLTSKLTHPNTIAIYDYGFGGEGVFYYAMEYLEGTDLERLVHAVGPLPLARALHIVEQVLGSLAEAHEAGLVHRDIKPANVMLTRRGGIPDFVKVLDFGLARPIDAGAAKVTSEEAIIGSPLYMAPETLVSGSAASPRSDVYAVAALLYFLLSGKDAFEAPTLPAIISRHMQGTPTPLVKVMPSGQVPAEIDSLLEAWMARDAAARPADARQALHTLELFTARYPWSQRNARAAPGEDIGHASTLILHAGLIADKQAG